MAAQPNLLPRIDPQFAKYQMRIGRSRIHRLGVFATEKIPPRRKVIEYTGERLTQLQAKRRWLRQWRRKGPKRYCLFEVNARWVVDGAMGGSGAELINHSCQPNLRTRRIGGRIFYFSRRRIRTGEELTVDYRWDRESPKVRCRCGSRKCRGTINRK
jgi:SET domain-containing protein